MYLKVISLGDVKTMTITWSHGFSFKHDNTNRGKAYFGKTVMLCLRYTILEKEISTVYIITKYCIQMVGLLIHRYTKCVFSGALQNFIRMLAQTCHFPFSTNIQFTLILLLLLILDNDIHQNPGPHEYEFSVFHLNARSVRNKLSYLEDILLSRL